MRYFSKSMAFIKMSAPSGVEETPCLREYAKQRRCRVMRYFCLHRNSHAVDRKIARLAEQKISLEGLAPLTNLSVVA